MRDIVARKVAERDARERGRSRVPGHTAEAGSNGRLWSLAAPPQGGRYPHTVGLRLGHALYATVENALEGAHRVGDYTFTSLPDVVRAALSAYFDGMELAAGRERGPRKRTTIGLDADLKHQYDGLPNRKRGEIIERALRTFLNRGMAPGS